MKRLLVLLGAIALFHSPSRAEDLAIIVSKNVALDDVTSAELAKIFLCEKATAPDGTKLLITTREKGSPERNVILASIYKFRDATFEMYFMQRVFKGELAVAPKLLPSATAMKKLVIINPGTIGYVSAAQIDDSVKVVKIDGLAPGDPNYPLKLHP